jgi:hypothetical protein
MSQTYSTSYIPDSFLRANGIFPFPKIGYTMNSLGNYSSYASEEDIKKQQEEQKQEMIAREKWNKLTEEEKKKYE